MKETAWLGRIWVFWCVVWFFFSVGLVWVFWACFAVVFHHFLRDFLDFAFEFLLLKKWQFQSGALTQTSGSKGPRMSFVFLQLKV